jgi:toxin FitB
LNWLLDTCVLSEYTRREPHAGVMAWLDAQPEPRLFMSAVSLAELDKGIAKLAAREGPERAGPLSLWLNRLRQRFDGRILPVDDAVWSHWARQSAEAELAGQALSPMDGLIMATAHSRGLGIVTRNVADFARYPQVFNPCTQAHP